MITGNAAIACVGGLVLALGANAGAIQALRSGLLRYVRRQRAPFHGDYSTLDAAALDRRLTAVERYVSALEFQVLMLLMSLGATVLLYGGLWFECVRYWLGGEPPTVVPELFFFFVLIDGSMMLGATASTWSERPGG